MNIDVITDEQPSVIDDTAATSQHEYSCEVCSTELVYSGRGRKPRLCADHKPSKSTATKRTGNVDNLVAQIGDLYSALGVGLTFIPSTIADGFIVVEGAQKLAESWRPLLERDPKVREMWAKMLGVSGWGTVIAAHAMIALPIMTNHKKVAQ